MMRKIRILLLGFAIVTAVGGAVAGNTNKKQVCEYYPQYYRFLDSYVPAGAQGVNYLCITSLGVCTYYKPYPWSSYKPCQSGLYLPIIW